MEMFKQFERLEEDMLLYLLGKTKNTKLHKAYATTLRGDYLDITNVMGAVTTINMAETSEWKLWTGSGVLSNSIIIAMNFKLNGTPYRLVFDINAINHDEIVFHCMGLDDKTL